MTKQTFTGYKHIAGRGEAYAIDAPNLSEMWARANTEQRKRLVEKMKEQGGFDFVCYDKGAQNISQLVIGWIVGDFNEDENGVVVGDFL